MDTSGCSLGQKGIWGGFSCFFLAKTPSPFSSICSCPDLVEATTFAAISLTLREHSWSLARFLLLFSAFTCKEHRNGCGCPPRPPPWSSRDPRRRQKSFWARKAGSGKNGWMDGQMGRFILSDPIMARQGDPYKALQPQGTKPALLPPEPGTQQRHNSIFLTVLLILQLPGVKIPMDPPPPTPASLCAH